MQYIQDAFKITKVASGITESASIFKKQYDTIIIYDKDT